MASEVVTSPVSRKPHHPGCISSRTHKLLCITEEEVTEKRRVRRVGTSYSLEGDLIAEFTEEETPMVWVKPDGYTYPATYAARYWEDIPKYDPAQVPQVGELWAYPPAPNTCRWLCVGSDEEKGVWAFVKEEDTRTAVVNHTGSENVIDRYIYTRSLPETQMIKVEKL